MISTSLQVICDSEGWILYLLIDPEENGSESVHVHLNIRLSIKKAKEDFSFSSFCLQFPRQSSYSILFDPDS